jgi:BNR repeat-containing family member
MNQLLAQIFVPVRSRQREECVGTLAAVGVQASAWPGNTLKRELQPLCNRCFKYDWLLLILALALPLSSDAALSPYNVDGATLHLWHLDEPSTPCIDSAAGGTNLTALSGGATLNANSFPGFGTALSTFDSGQVGTEATNRNAALSALPLATDTSDNVSMAFANPTNGAFTFEAIVRVDFNPLLNMASRGSGMQIISGEGNVDADRVFQWRLDPAGVGGGDNSVPRIEFINIRQNSGLQSIIMPIPTNGPNAIASNRWFHVAVAYNGNENVAGNISFYWTLLDTNATEANLIGSDDLFSDLVAGVSCDFTVGNEGRSTGGSSDNWIGLIDEVRISSMARGPLEFYFAGGTNGGAPQDSSEITPGPALAKLVPVEDGDTNTSEFGYAGSSAINAVSFIRSALVTVSNKQVIAYYGRHQTDSAYAFNNRIWVARRTVGSNLWEVFRTSFQPNNIADGHDVVCFGIDGDGFMHMSWGMHGDAFHYARSVTNVVGNEPIAFGPDTTMTGTTNENTATYPQFLTLPGGDLLYIYRKGGSGSGDTFINRYVRATKTWTNIHHVGGAALPFIKGTGWSPDYNAYLQMPCLDAEGGLFLVWTWRDTPAYQSNGDLAFAKSLDGGVSWERFDGANYDLPISQFGESGNPNTAAERILQIPQNSSLINQAGMTLDADGNPVVATWWAPGTPTNNFRRQYMVVFRSTNGWAVRQVSQRTNDPIGTIQQDGVVRDLGRPVVVTDSQDRIIVLYRDNFLGNGLTIVHSLPKAVDPDRLVWTTFDLTTDNLGNHEPVIDLARWQMDNNLHALYQPSSGLGYTPPANTASQIGVLEWNAAAYFQHKPLLSLALTNGTDAVLNFNALPSWGYRLSMSTNLSSWQPLSTWNHINGAVQYVHQNGGHEPQQFWKLEYQEGGIASP